MKLLKYWFLMSFIILIIMGSLLKLNNYENFIASYIGGIINFLLFLILLLKGETKVKETKNSSK